MTGPIDPDARAAGPAHGLPSLSARPPRRLSVETPAKVNLLLGVGPLRPDGFHELTTLYYALGLADTLEAELVPEPAGGSEGPVRLSLTDQHLPGLDRLPTDERNLAVAACRLLQRRFGVRQGVELTLSKRIPLSAGLAGGSADAAAALVAANALWQLGLGTDELATLGAELGSDVPFALYGGAAVGAGRGERITAVPAAGWVSFVLVCAHIGLSTPAVYRELDRMRSDGSAAPTGADVSPELLAATADGDVAGIAATVHNDMQQAAVAMRPELGEILSHGLQVGARAALVSGSGPTCVFLADDPDHAEALSTALEKWTRSDDVVLTSGGPWPGARIVEARV
jgi:4-diphosphocytidyl-2-C-methyl-D-erythritol kinase